MAQGVTVYNSIPKPLPGNVASIDVWGRGELGDGLYLTLPGGTLDQVRVVLSSWACEQGSWGSGCVSTPGDTFAVPITLNIYGVTYGTGDVPSPTAPAVGTLTQTFNIPYRPSADPTHCPSTPTKWYDKKDNTCYNGLAVPIEFDLWNLDVQIPAIQRIIVTVVWNSTFYGPEPIGTSAACYGTAAGCPYDSLNVGTEGNGPTGLLFGAGDILDWNGIFINLINNANSCNGSGPGGVEPVPPDAYGVLALNTLASSPCWAGYHPLINVTAVPATPPPFPPPPPPRHRGSHSHPR
jgi:hypothetical protein